MKVSRTRVALVLVLVASVLIVGLAFKFDVVTKVRQVGLSKVLRLAQEKLSKEGLFGLLSTVSDKLGDQPISMELKYSLFEPTSFPPIESAAERNALPEYKVIPAIDVASLAPSRETGFAYDTWHRSHGNDSSSKFSAHTQVDKTNVTQLELAWTYASGADLGDAGKPGTTVQTNPVIVNGRLFVGGERYLISIDAASGREIWRLELPGPVARRGLVWEPNADFAKSRLFVPTSRGVYAVGAADGKIRTDFGDKGVVGGEVSLISPAIVKDKLIIAIVKPAVEAYDLKTGKLLWTRPLIDKSEKRNSHLYGGVPWAGMSADQARGLVFVSTGNPRPQLVGTTRPGDNRNACSVVAIDVETGAIKWAFQEVQHDLWDLDIPSPPVLTTITREGKRIDVVATATKLGNTLLLDRESGKPIFDYRMKRAPTSKIPGERTAAYQPALELPEPFSKQTFEESDITNVSDSARQAVLGKMRGARNGFFEPPVIGGKVVVFGPGGGAEWPGAAADPRSGMLYIPSSQFPWIIRAPYLDLKSTADTVADVPGNALYQSECAGCHKPAGEGWYEKEFVGDKHYSVLNGITFLRDRKTLVSKAEFDRNHQGEKLKRDITTADLETLYTYFSALDKRSDSERSFAISPYWQLLLDDKGYPGSKPPWGFLTALNLNTGKIAWKVPFGEYDQLMRDGSPVKGQRNSGGVIATASGLLFATGTVDNKIRAFDSADGRELWSHKLPAAGSTPPATYMIEGVQYLVVVASGGQFPGFSGRSDKIIAFRLPKGQL